MTPKSPQELVNEFDIEVLAPVHINALNKLPIEVDQYRKWLRQALQSVILYAAESNMPKRLEHPPGHHPYAAADEVDFYNDAIEGYRSILKDFAQKIV